MPAIFAPKILEIINLQNEELTSLDLSAVITSIDEELSWQMNR
jgi:hypothetical protein